MEIDTSMNDFASRQGARPGLRRLLGLSLIVPALFAGCDYFDVVNPGPVDDDVLNDRTAHMALVNGAALALSDAVATTAFTTGAITREIFPGGSTGVFGITPQQQQGVLLYDDGHTNWTSHQRARGIAENGFARFEDNIAPDPISGYEPAGRIALWAGYAYRVLGENWCEFTVDGGPALPASDALTRAEQWFTTALQIGTNLDNAEIRDAALAGRAQVRVDLGDWTGAVADAQQVPVDFAFSLSYNNLSREQGNYIFWAGSNNPFRSYTVWRTPYESYYLESGDPRVAWTDTGMTGDAAVMDLGRVPFYRQEKYTEEASPIRLASGREMRLIVAESLLRDGDVPGALGVVNELRSAVGVDPVAASSLDDAWTIFKRERGIELWLEGRRMGDLRRWEAAGTPGALDELEVPGDASRLSINQTLCYAIPISERETNSNIPTSP